MSILYGSIGYFEKQIENYMTINKYEDIRNIRSILEQEILNDSFVEDEKIREKFLQNLRLSVVHYKEKHCSLLK